VIRYELPYPPTTNNLFANGGSGRYKTRGYKTWQEAAGYSIIEQGRQRLKGPVSIAIALVRPDRRKRDASNVIKPIEDLLVMMGVIEDDSLVQRVSAEWVGHGSPCVVLVQTAEEALAA
jgi:Holliday junction resolvase RusA-like endonuclease